MRSASSSARGRALCRAVCIDFAACCASRATSQRPATPARPHPALERVGRAVTLPSRAESHGRSRLALNNRVVRCWQAI